MNKIVKHDAVSSSSGRARKRNAVRAVATSHLFEHFFEGHEDGRGLHHPVLRWRGMATPVQLLPPPGDVRAVDGRHRRGMLQDLLRREAQHGPHRQIVELPPPRQLRQAGLERARRTASAATATVVVIIIIIIIITITIITMTMLLLPPVLVHEENGLRTALLARARVGVLVADPRHVLLVAHVRAQYLPVEACVLHFHLPGGIPPNETNPRPSFFIF